MGERPTRFRWKLAYIMFFITFMVYMDRVNLSVATPTIMKEFGFSKLEMGYMQTAFFIGYSFMQVPGGIMAELFGHRKIVPIAVTLWSFFTALTAFCGSLWSFIIARVLFGVGEGPVYPAFNNFVANWFNKGEKAKANAFLIGGTFIGPVLGPVTTIALLVAFGWRSVFIIFGLLGLVAGALWYWFATDLPRKNSRVNLAEVAHIESGTGQADEKKEVAPWRGIL